MAKINLPPSSNQIIDLKEIAKLVNGLGFSVEETVEWLVTPILAQNNKTPLEIIIDGRSQELISQLISLAQGNIGS